MIEGNKQKMIDGNREIITDLDTGKIDIIDPAHKMYVEVPFPPQGAAGQAIGGKLQHATFAPTGKTGTIAGYKCDEYKGTGKFAVGEFSTVSCVSKTAPGASEYSNFQKAMLAKVKNQMAPTEMPDGIPLTQDTTTIMNPAGIPNLPPQAAAQLKSQLANRPPLVTRTAVTKVEAEKIAASELQIPAGYVKREPPTGFGSMKVPAAPPNQGAPPSPSSPKP
jgi:hypothetical protein